ncbi:hypothetical protein [Stenomitos frigidus]|uniref:Glycosyltransferase RgtA/B/C/D-like domain-containing protein n=1 Tax=Stenomitos frigidus ULC18 TaxID=2107698 RepID=A0A2T1DXA2_9CYAN|nr:hypothetical protein [Stenomitos frigidus]PSB25136.1 hypothetical protein C7B82_24485 [Stenomitos frigidus ULC18]
MKRIYSHFWFILNLVFAFGYSLIWLKVAFAAKYSVQADASMYVFWMQRFLDPALLPNDLNVAYHESISPVGYTALFKGIASLGVPPMLASKLLPIVLTLTTTVYCFNFCLQLLPIPATAFVSTLLFNQHLWLTDDVNSATPRAFVYPFFFAFLYYLNRGANVRAIVAIGLLGLFYPTMMFVAVGVLAVRLVSWTKGRLWLSQRRGDYLLLAAAIGMAGLTLLPYGLFGHAEFGPLVTAAQARAMPEFQAPLGRISFFNHRDPLDFWFDGIHSGLGLSLNPLIVSVGLLLPVLWCYPRQFPLVQQCRPAMALLLQILIAAIGFFLAAHALLFHLFLPSRYTLHSLRMVVAIAGGVALCILIDAAVRAYQQRWQGKTARLVAWGIAVLVAVPLLFFPQIFWAKHFTRAGLVAGTHPALYEFFQQQPKDSLIATLSAEADNLPVFAQRSVLVSGKYAIPYHPAYYNQIRQRAIALIHAQYSFDGAAVRELIQKYGVDFWLVERTAFTPAYLDSRWLKLFEPANTEARAQLATTKPPVLAQMMDRCKVFESGNFVVLQADCLRKET